MAQISLDSTALDELNTVETRTLFDTAQKLSSLGVGRIVNLPQIVVVGDQSSGKSSVLEAISHVHFPVEDGVCTRFATELVLRPGSHRFVTASVQFADSTRPAHSLQVADFNQEDIDKIIISAKDQMELSGTGRSFSKDVLRLEIEGPDMYPLTLVDLPGIFHTATSTQSREDMATVMELVESYMKKPNSIILAIICANNQLANQVVMHKAAKHDPNKMRTLGVITKPDLLREGATSEHDYLQVIRGREAVHNLALGWHVLRNRADYEKDLGSRDMIEEEFFSAGAWASVPRANRGVAALRAKLSHVLHDHIRKSLPGVLQDIQDKLCDQEAELGRLGQPRTTPEDMRAYLIDISITFQRLVRDAIRGHYVDPFFGGFNGTHRKLRSKLRNFNRVIRHILLTVGSAQEVSGSHYGTAKQLSTPEYLADILQSYTERLSCPEVVTWAELSAQLRRQAAANRGTEFPGFANMDNVTQLFQKQAEPWQGIAELHLGEVIHAVKVFIDEVFEHIVGPPSSSSTTVSILSTFVDPFFDEEEELLSAKLKELLRPLKEGYALPLDVDFQEAMEKTTAHHAAAAAETEGGSDAENRTTTAIYSQNSDEFGTERIVQTMQTFYDMALRTFTDNLINLAIESCLIQDLPKLFTPILVNSMDDKKLAEFAAESEEVRDHRSQLLKDIKLLKQGLEQCRRHKPRPTARTVPSAQPVPETPQKKAPSGEGPKAASSPPDGLGKPGSDDARAASKAPMSKTAKHPKVKLPPSLNQAPSSTGISRIATPPPKESRTVPVIISSSQEAQNTTLASSKSPPPGTGLFGSSWTGSSFSTPANGPNAPFTTGNSLFRNTPATPNTGAEKTNPFASYVGGSSSPFAANVTTASSASKSSTSQSGGLFGGFSTTSPAFGSPPTQVKGGLGGPGVGPSSSSAPISVFCTPSGISKSPGKALSDQTQTTRPGYTPSGGLFALPVSTSPNLNWSLLKHDLKKVPTSISPTDLPHESDGDCFQSNSNPKYWPYEERGANAWNDIIRMPHICTTKVFEDFSQEEIRLKDYVLASSLRKPAC